MSCEEFEDLGGFLAVENLVLLLVAKLAQRIGSGYHRSDLKLGEVWHYGNLIMLVF